mgnify:CR=1 FL=1
MLSTGSRTLNLSCGIDDQATAATTMVMSPLHGNWLPFAVAAGGLILLTGGAILLALSQVEYLYDQAAARGFDSRADIMSSGIGVAVKRGAPRPDIGTVEAAT